MSFLLANVVPEVTRTTVLHLANEITITVFLDLMKIQHCPCAISPHRFQITGVEGGR